MKVVISQPMYLPWAGLFDQIRLCDVFIHFDDVLLSIGRYFTNRIQVKTPQGQKWLTVPLVRSSRGIIKDVRIDNNSNWRAKHLKTFSHSLSKAPFFSDAVTLLDRIYSYDTDRLSAFNINAIETIALYLGFKRTFLMSSDLQVGGGASLKLLDIVKKVGGQTYITGHGAKNYLDHDLFAQSGVEVEYMDYNIPPYPQFYGEFTQYVSIIDLIAHTGPKSIDFMNSQTINWRDFSDGRP